jgi:hypothetical protein
MAMKEQVVSWGAVVLSVLVVLYFLKMYLVV